MYNSVAKKGFLYNKLFYKKYKQRVPRPTKPVQDEAVPTDDTENLSYDAENEYMLFFRTCLVSRDKEELKIKLTQSIKEREILMKNQAIDFPKLFPFYFLSPDLVISIFYPYGITH